MDWSGTLHSLTEWFFDHFLEHMVSSRLLIILLDGHSSQYTLELVKLAAEHNIVIFCLPPHATANSQPSFFFVEVKKLIVGFWSSQAGQLFRWQLCMAVVRTLKKEGQCNWCLTVMVSRQHGHHNSACNELHDSSCHGPWLIPQWHQAVSQPNGP